MGTSTVSTAGRDFYLAYLNSPAWRATRNRALHLAGWRCQRCGGKRDLQVHHLTYDRLGAEWDQDLEVLCDGCHRRTHIEAGAHGPLGVYLTLARQALERHGFASFADLSAEVKALCAQHRIVCDPRRIEKALALLAGGRPQPVPIRRRDRVVFTAAYVVPDTAAAGAVIQLIRERLVRPWPGSARQPAVQAQVIAEQARDHYRAIYLADRRRRPVQERLAEIWR